MTEWSAPEGAGPSSDPGAAPAPPDTGYGPGYGYGPGFGPSNGWQPAPPVPSAPKPGIIPLRPLGVGELLDGSFSAIRTAPIAALGIAAVFILIEQALQLLLSYTVLRPATTTGPDGTTITDTADAAARAGASLIVTTIVSSIVILLLTGVMAAIIGERIIGRRVTIRNARTQLRPVAWPLVRVALTITGVIAGIVTITLLPGIAVAAAGSSGGGSALLGLGFFVLVVPVMYVWIALSLAPAAVVLERQGARAALRRSRKLMRGAWWRVFWISLLAWLIAAVISAVLSVPFLFVGGRFGPIFSGQANNFSFFTLLMTALGGFVGGTLSRPFQGGVSALLYIDRRMRAEALDVALQAASAEPAGATSAAT